MRRLIAWILVLAAGLAPAAAGADARRLVYRVAEGGDATAVAEVLGTRARGFVRGAAVAVEDARVPARRPAGMEPVRTGRGDGDP